MANAPCFRAADRSEESVLAACAICWLATDEGRALRQQRYANSETNSCKRMRKRVTSFSLRSKVVDTCTVGRIFNAIADTALGRAYANV